MTWALVEVIYIIELTSNLTLEGISEMFLDWFYNRDSASGSVVYHITVTPGICFGIYELLSFSCYSLECSLVI